MNPYRLRSYLLFLIVSFIWGIAGPIIKFTLGGFSPLTFLVYRFAISSVVALFFLPQMISAFRKPLNVVVTLIVFALINAPITLALLFFGLAKTTALDETLISVMAPLVMAVFGVLFLREIITRREKIGMATALVGIGITVFQPLLASGEGLHQLSGNFLIVVYLISGGVASILIKKLLREDIDPYTPTNLSFILGFLTLAPFAIYQNGLMGLLQSIKAAPLPYHLGVLYMAIISGTLAYILATKAQKTIEVSEAAVFTYLYPIFAIPLAVFWLHEKITIPYIVGAVVIAVGVVIAEYKKTRYN